MPENQNKDNISEVHTQLGQYFLQEKIAQGGMAEIFKGIASDIHGIKRNVVIKKILPQIAANKEYVDMLVSEAKIAVQLSHGNIAQIYDLGRAGNDYFMVMEFVDGKSLSQIHKRCLKNGELMPLEYLLFFISEVASGLDYMHNRINEAGQALGIVHRDISPQNIIISYSGTVKIIDFGIAKSAFKIDNSETGILKGKFAYMSPEQARGEAIDGRSDIFSLGIILHEMSSGRRLFKDQDNKQTIRNVRRANIEPPSTYNQDLPEEIDDIVMKALQKEPKQRYQRAADMRDDLLKLLHTHYPEFKHSNIIGFITKLFSEDIAERLEDKEDEHTPLLIVDQTQSAIDVSAPQVMKQFMLDDMPQEVKEVVKEEIPEKPKGPTQLELKYNTFIKKFDRLVIEFKKMTVKTAIVAAVVSSFILLSLAGWKFGWWKAWSDFFKPVSLTAEKEATPPTPIKYTILVIDSIPQGANIFIDDQQNRYKTPITIQDLVADGKPHTIGIFLEKHKYFNTTFTANPDDLIRFKPILQPEFGSIEIASYPDGAEVLINGGPAGATPFKMEKIDPGTILKITVTKDGFYPWEGEVKVAQNQLSMLNTNLVRMPLRPGEPPIPIPKIGREEEPLDTGRPPTRLEIIKNKITSPPVVTKPTTPSGEVTPDDLAVEPPRLPGIVTSTQPSEPSMPPPSSEPSIPPPTSEESVPETASASPKSAYTDLPSSTSTLTEVPLLPPQAAFDEVQIEHNVTAPVDPNAPAPSTRENKMEIEY